MKRIKGFEWEDQPWFPSFLRQYMMDFLRFVLNTGNLYQAITPVLIDALQGTKSTTVIDLCSGAGGAIQSIQSNIRKATGNNVPFVVTDLYPNLRAYRQLQKDSHGSITYYHEPVDATQVPPALQGVRTILSGFHHFDELTARQVLQNAVNERQGIAVFDGSSRSIGFIIHILIFHPIAFLLFTPFIKPFSLKRLLFTYVLPVVPFCTIWDGIVSVLRLYTPDELLAFTKEIQGGENYTWSSGKITNHIGIQIAYLTGYPSTSGLHQ